MAQPVAGRTLTSDLVVLAARLVRAVHRAAEIDVPHATLRLLAQIDELGPVTITELARADRCAQPTMSSAVQNLQAKGWVAKTANPADARSALVTLTDAGSTVLGDARRRHEEVVARRLAEVGADPAAVAVAVDLLATLTRHTPRI